LHCKTVRRSTHAIDRCLHVIFSSVDLAPAPACNMQFQSNSLSPCPLHCKSKVANLSYFLSQFLRVTLSLCLQLCLNNNFVYPISTAYHSCNWDSTNYAKKTILFISPTEIAQTVTKRKQFCLLQFIIFVTEIA